MFSLRNFLMTGFRNAIGKMEDYQIILNATGWYEKGVLLEEDLAELQKLIDEKNNPTSQPESTPEPEEGELEEEIIPEEPEQTVEEENIENNEEELIEDISEPEEENNEEVIEEENSITSDNVEEEEEENSSEIEE